MELGQAVPQNPFSEIALHMVAGESGLGRVETGGGGGWRSIHIASEQMLSMPVSVHLPECLHITYKIHALFIWGDVLSPKDADECHRLNWPAEVETPEGAWCEGGTACLYSLSLSIYISMKSRGSEGAMDGAES